MDVTRRSIQFYKDRGGVQSWQTDRASRLRTGLGDCFDLIHIFGSKSGKYTLLSNSAKDFDNTEQCTVVWKRRNDGGQEKPPVGKVQ